MSYLINSDVSNGTYYGEYYVFDTSGGFTIEEGFPTVDLKKIPFTVYDVTDAIQIYYSVRRFNDKIGIVKDEYNNQVFDVLCYDPSSRLLTVDDITFGSDEFINTINANSIISMGSMSTLYSDFNYTIMTYFSEPVGFSSLFTYNNFTVNNGVFDASAYMNLINGITFQMDGNYITDLSGSFTVHGINENLINACEYDLFNNRPKSGKYGVADGFMEGDLIFIPNGISVTLTMDVNLDLEPVHNSHFQDIGPLNLSKIENQITYTDTSTNVSKVTTYSGTNITQTFSVPILLVLTNLDTFNINNYGYNWIDMTTSTIGVKNWMAISLSANGQFQSAVNSDGDVYISSDYGMSWENTFNIGATLQDDGTYINESLSNCIAISLNGQIQTACNGSQIFVSYDYGNTWNIKQNTVTENKIFVCISLNGQHQAVISCGDTIYRSSDYGNTWTYISDEFDALYNSIQSFQYAGISMSYSGQYQTIVCEQIYTSNDYGVSWTQQDIYSDGLDHGFDDRNWTGVSISSTGQYQTAVDNGGDIYRSSDYGDNWTMVDYTSIVDKLWTGVSISANGRFQTAIDKLNGTVHLSIDFGHTWYMSPSSIIQNRFLQAVSVSANGQYQTVVEDNGAIYISNLL